MLLYIPILQSITYNTIYRPIYIYKGCYTVIYKTLKTIESLALHERLYKLLTVLLYIPVLHSITYNTIYRPIYIYKGCYTVIYKTLKTIESLALHERLPKLLTVLLYIPILHSITYNTIYRPIYIYKGCYTVIYKTLKTIESLALHERLPKLLTVLLYIPILHSITYNTIYRPIYIYKGCYTVELLISLFDNFHVYKFLVQISIQIECRVKLCPVLILRPVN